MDEIEKPAEILLFDFLTEKIDAATPGDVPYELDLHDTVYQSMKAEKPRGIRISDAVGDLAPEPGGGLKEYDVSLQLVCFAKVEGTDKKARQPAVCDVFAIEKWVCEVLYADPTLGGRECDVVVKKGTRGYDSLDGNAYAIANIWLVVNPSGESY